MKTVKIKEENRYFQKKKKKKKKKKENWRGVQMTPSPKIKKIKNSRINTVT